MLHHLDELSLREPLIEQPKGLFQTIDLLAVVFDNIKNREPEAFHVSFGFWISKHAHDLMNTQAFAVLCLNVEFATEHARFNLCGLEQFFRLLKTRQTYSNRAARIDRDQTFPIKENKRKFTIIFPCRYIPTRSLYPRNILRRDRPHLPAQITFIVLRLRMQRRIGQMDRVACEIIALLFGKASFVEIEIHFLSAAFAGDFFFVLDPVATAPGSDIGGRLSSIFDNCSTSR